MSGEYADEGDEEAEHVTGLDAVATSLSNGSCQYIDEAASGLDVEPRSSLPIRLSSSSQSADEQDVGQE